MDSVIDIRGIARDDDILAVTLHGLPDRPGIAYFVFDLLARESIDVDIILQSISESQKNDIVFTVRLTDRDRINEVLNRNLAAIGADSFVIDNVSKVSVSGVGMKGTPGVAAKVFRALYDAGVEIMHISTSEIKISLLMRTEYAARAMDALYAAFNFTV
jgi:aspartate kinase